jgi:hypothetical protein
VGFNLEPASNARNVVDRNVAFGPFDPAEIGAVDAALVGQTCAIADLTLQCLSLFLQRVAPDDFCLLQCAPLLPWLIAFSALSSVSCQSRALRAAIE